MNAKINVNRKPPSNVLGSVIKLPIGEVAEPFIDVDDVTVAVLTEGVHHALGRKPKDFTTYAREIASFGVWKLAA